MADLANVRAAPVLNLIVIGPSPRRIRAVSSRAETRARTRVSLPSGREGEQGSDGGRRTKSETQAVPQSLARDDCRGRSTREEGGGGRKMWSFDLGAPAGVDVRVFANSKGISDSKGISGSRWKSFSQVYQSCVIFRYFLHPPIFINRLIACVKIVHFSTLSLFFVTIELIVEPYWLRFEKLLILK